MTEYDPTSPLLDNPPASRLSRHVVTAAGMLTGLHLCVRHRLCVHHRRTPMMDSSSGCVLEEGKVRPERPAPAPAVRAAANGLLLVDVPTPCRPPGSRPPYAEEDTDAPAGAEGEEKPGRTSLVVRRRLPTSTGAAVAAAEEAADEAAVAAAPNLPLRLPPVLRRRCTRSSALVTEEAVHRETETRVRGH